ncbi:hypothetical protein QYE76_037717 [Lolium multiflorum]|uniref:No apical meristem-associated C-terminal domain-containing protein n=1 Tax=Lolium multiflorum TaxID=4521 RepID=A0AAD8UX58_LOLMU|nr:hypothetical protein QYE76_037717 [Lolium multiflorum]
MNVGSSFLNDDEAADGEEEYEDVDEEGEGLIEPRHPGRAANYTIAEDKLLCKTWLTIGMDPTTGTDQTRETYWVRMTDYFNTNTSGIERTMRSLRSRWSGINTDCQKWAGVQANIDVLNPSGTNENDRNSMAQGLFRDVGKKNKKGNKILGKPFTLHHCYEVLGNEEKWKTRGKLDAATMAANATGDATIIDDDDSSDEGKKRSSTPHSINNGRRNVPGRKTAKEMKGRKAGDDDIAMAMERIANARLQANEDRKMQRNLEKEAMDAIEARRAALEERIAANEERKLALEEKRQAAEEHARLAEEERKLFLMDTSHMDERQKEYVNLLRDEVLAKKRLLVANMNTSTTGMFGGGMFGGGMGGMGGMGSMPMPTMGGMGGMGSMPMPSMGGMAGMGGYGGMAGMGGSSYGGVFGGTMGGSVSGVYGSMGAPPGGFVSSMNATIPPSTQDDEDEEEGVDLENAEV